MQTITMRLWRNGARNSTSATHSKSLSCTVNARLTTPTIQQLTAIADCGKLNLSGKELNGYKDAIEKSISQYKRLDELYNETIRSLKPSKWEKNRTWYIPQEKDNIFNGWYCKSNIAAERHSCLSNKLDGHTIAVKDCISVAGLPMMNGSTLMEGYISEEDATVVNRALLAGARVLGKANCDELCISGTSFTCANGPVLNPNDRCRSAGGSSSGNAVLIKSGEVSLGIGSDQAGSIRNPASWTGIVGLKPTYGLVPFTGALSMEPCLDHLGPMAANVKDCAVLLEVLAGFDDGLDGRQQNYHHNSIVTYTKHLENKDLCSIKIAILDEGFELCHTDVQNVVFKATDLFKQYGAELNHVSAPLHTLGYSVIWFPIGTIGIYYTVLQNAGKTVGIRGKQTITSYEKLKQALSVDLGRTTTAIKFSYLLGRYMVEKHGLSLYTKAQSMGRELNKTYNRILSDYDAIVMPTTPYTARKIPDFSEDLSPGIYMEEATGNQINTAPFNVTGHPAISVNCGYIDGLPVGLQIIGRHWDDGLVLKLANVFDGV